MRRDAAGSDELDTAYVDGVAELSLDERRGVEARLAREPDARAEHAAVRTLLGRLRALPPEGREPDWTAMERSIRDAVGDAVPRPWWRRWTWLAPIATLATAAAILFVVWPRPALRVTPHPTVAQPTAPAAPEDSVGAVALWLDGAQVDVEPDAAAALIALDPADDEPDEVALLPASDLAWVDNLDDDAIARAERWLARKKKG